MQFESIPFAAALLAVLTLYWAMARSRLAQKILLLTASMTLLWAFSWKFVGVLSGSIAVNYILGRCIVSTEGIHRKRILTMGVLGNLAYLGVFKYHRFFIDNVEAMVHFLGLDAHVPLIKLIFPLGISFYTFQAIAYLVDLARDKGHPAKNPLDFFLFQSFILQLLSGPICRSHQLLPQIEKAVSPRMTDISRAVSLILSGLFKRMVLASLLFTYGVSDTFYSPDDYSAWALWVAMFGYSIQIYADFSGYTDMMRGFGLLFGFRIPDNFNGPYVANSVGEFWRRWHMTFSHWLRDYIYFPLGGSHCPRYRTYFNLFMTMFACGIWHGPKWGYFLWGTMHGFALVHYKWSLDEARKRGRDPKKETPPFHRWLMGWMWTFWFVSFSRIVFYSTDLDTAWIFISRMLKPGVAGDGFNLILFPIIVLGLAMNFWGRPVRETFVRVSDRLPYPARLVFWTGMFLLVAVLRPSGVAPNAYFGF